MHGACGPPSVRRFSRPGAAWETVGHGPAKRPVTRVLRLTSVVPGALSGLRADQALAKVFPEHSRTRIQGWIRTGAATLDGAAVKARDRVSGGERISVRCEVEADDRWAAQPGSLTILHEDPDLLVLDKPPGLVVHPGAGNRDGTLLNRLLAYDPGLRAVPRAGLVHRLDKDTSGLMLVARSLRAHTRLVARIKSREVERTYEAVVVGSPPPSGTVEAAIGRHRTHRIRMAVGSHGRPAVTHYRVIERYPRHARLEVRLETGRTHQIRVHLAHLGCPIVGDATYGGRGAREAAHGVPDTVATFPRQALHARRLSLEHPVSGRMTAFENTLAPDMQELVEVLRAGSADSR